jgi:hypothetical protein
MKTPLIFFMMDLVSAGPRDRMNPRTFSVR